MKTTYTDGEIRKWIDRLLDEESATGPMTAYDWEFVKKQGVVADFHDALEDSAYEGEIALEETLQEIVHRAAQLITDVRERDRSAIGGATRSRQAIAPLPTPGTPPLTLVDDDTPREVLLSYAVATLVSQDAEVRAFRDEVNLHGPVIGQGFEGGWDTTAEWVEARWRTERPPEVADVETLPLLQYPVYPNMRWDPERGECEEDGPPPVRALRVAPGGVLDRLGQLAARLAETYHWDQAAAIAFVLTNDVPITPRLSVTIDWCEQIPALTRIVIVVDPTLPPKELEAQYQEARRQIVGDKPPRALDAKTMWLAALTAGRAANTSLADLLAQWNRAVGWPPALYGSWTYTDKERFRRARLRAEQTFLGLDHKPTASAAHAKGRTHERGLPSRASNAQPPTRPPGAF